MANIDLSLLQAEPLLVPLFIHPISARFRRIGAIVLSPVGSVHNPRPDLLISPVGRSPGSWRWCKGATSLGKPTTKNHYSGHHCSRLIFSLSVQFCSNWKFSFRFKQFLKSQWSSTPGMVSRPRIDTGGRALRSLAWPEPFVGVGPMPRRAYDADGYLGLNDAARQFCRQ